MSSRSLKNIFNKFTDNHSQNKNILGKLFSLFFFFLKNIGFWVYYNSYYKHILLECLTLTLCTLFVNFWSKNILITKDILTNYLDERILHINKIVQSSLMSQLSLFVLVVVCLLLFCCGYHLYLIPHLLTMLWLTTHQKAECSKPTRVKASWQFSMPIRTDKSVLEIQSC